MKSLRDYADSISGAMPSELVDILIEMTVDYAEVCDMLLPLERAKTDFWLKNKKLNSEKPVSDKTIEMMWLAVEDEKINGAIQKRAEIYKKSLERIMSNVKAIIKEKENEAKNLY